MIINEINNICNRDFYLDDFINELRFGYVFIFIVLGDVIVGGHLYFIVAPFYMEIFG